MLVPLTDPEHPLSKQMLRLIGAHSHVPQTADAEAIDPEPVVEAVDPLRARPGRTLVRRVLGQAGMSAATPTI